MEQRESAFDRLYTEYKHLCLFSQGGKFDKFKMAEFSGKVTFAAEYRLITGDEWEFLFCKVLKAFNGG